MSVVLNQLTIAYGNHKAVDGLTATFTKGVTGLLGPNGAGKSSLIKGLLGLVPIHSGSAFILDQSVIASQKTIRQMVGYMPEDDCLIPGLTGIQMVQYAGQLSGMGGKDAMQRAHDVLFAVGLGEARYRQVDHFSSGMKQRIKLAQAIVHDPELLFLDEPTSGMDPKGRQEMLDLIREIATNGKMSVVLATHILIDVERTCERVVMLDKGRLMESGQVSELRKDYTNAYTIRVEGDFDLYRSFLENKGCRFQEAGKHHWDVHLPSGASSHLLFEAAKEKQVQLRKLIPSIQTLEDVFVKRVGENRAHL